MTGFDQRVHIDFGDKAVDPALISAFLATLLTNSFPGAVVSIMDVPAAAAPCPAEAPGRHIAVTVVDGLHAADTA